MVVTLLNDVPPEAGLSGAYSMARVALVVERTREPITNMILCQELNGQNNK